MNKVHVLDCTLRDGGYCNQWKFGNKEIKRIISSLVEANIDIIECGFLTNNNTYDKDCTLFTSLRDMKSVFPENRKDKMLVAMMNFGEYDINNLPPNDGNCIDGIRIAFHKKDRVEALKLCEIIKNKGYKVFVQAMVSLSYDDKEFLDLTQRVNEIMPYAFYIVDSFGMMKSKDLTRLFYMVEHNLKENIWIGFHSHNNMQLSFSNAQTLTSVNTNRNLIIDSSIYGMGRGAGNLNTELFVKYLNETINSNYDIKPLLEAIDEIINAFYQKNYWGYSLPNYLSAFHNAHPNYASYLDDKRTLTVGNINEIFEMMDDEKKFEYDKQYIEEMYLKYMEKGKTYELHEDEFKKIIFDKDVILIAPGKSSAYEKEKIKAFVDNKNIVVVSINCDYPYVQTDYIFLSNLRRFKELDCTKREKCIITSNIPADDVFLKKKYQDLINRQENVEDNAGLMAIKLMINYGAKEIILAGYDGYSHDVEENYGDSQMAYVTKNAILDSMNYGMTKILKEYSKSVKLNFLTTPRYVKLEDE